MNRNQKSTIQKQYDDALDKLDAAIQERLQRLPKYLDALAERQPGKPRISRFLLVVLSMELLIITLIIIYELYMLSTSGCVSMLCQPFMKIGY